MTRLKCAARLLHEMRSMAVFSASSVTAIQQAQPYTQQQRCILSSKMPDTSRWIVSNRRFAEMCVESSPCPLVCSGRTSLIRWKLDSGKFHFCCTQYRIFETAVECFFGNNLLHEDGGTHETPKCPPQK